MIKFTDEDFLRDLVVPAGWYEVELGAYSKELTKAGDSSMHVYKDCRIMRDADTGNEEGIAGAYVTLRLSDKPTARGFLAAFARALGVEVKPGTVFDESAGEGKRIVAEIVPNEFQGRISNSFSNKYRTPKV